MIDSPIPPKMTEQQYAAFIWQLMLDSKKKPLNDQATNLENQGAFYDGGYGLSEEVNK